MKKTYISMTLAAFFWSGAFIAGKYTVPYIPPVTLTFLRFFFAVIILYIFIQTRKAKGQYEFKLEKKHVPTFLVTGIVGMIGYHLLFFTALKYTTAINSSIIAGINPIATVVLSFVFLKQKLRPIQVCGVIISFVGVVLTITGANWEIIKSFTLNKGDLIMLLAVLAWAIYSVYSKSKSEGIPPLAITYYSFLVCVIGLLPFVILENPWTFLGQVPLSGYIAVIYMSVFASVIGYLVQQTAIRKIGPSQASVFINLVPFFSMILAVIIIGETVEPIKIFTAILIVLGVFICQKN